jgi:tetratricopeptide (TPR) repeat protein
MQNRAEKLSMEADEVNAKRGIITKLSNLALHLYSWYIRSGHARNEQEAKAVKIFFKIHLPAYVNPRGFYEQLYYHQSYCWYAFIRQDFLMYYRHTQKWVDLFVDQPAMIAIESGHYIKGMHNLMNAHFDLRNFRKFEEAIQQFKLFSETDVANLHANNRVQTFVYLSNAQINHHMITGSFEDGLKLITGIEEKLEEYKLFLDQHRVLVLNYKIATLHFAAGNYDKSIDYLREIINDNVDLRNDIQCYSRLLHLLAHYEMGNFDIMDHLIKSVYRFMRKMENLSALEEEMFSFLKKNSHLKPSALKPAFYDFLEKIKSLEKQPFQARAFAYLDIISWVESKIENKSLAEIIRQKYLASKRK